MEAYRPEVAHVDVLPQLDENERFSLQGEPRATENVAILVFHGMGQQIPFQTQNDLAQVLLDGDSMRRGSDAEKGQCVGRIVTVGHERLGRAEMTLGGYDGVPRKNVHIFEAYWAPITAGHISAGETLVFFLTAGLRGMAFALRGKFRRFLFGREFSYKAAPGTWIRLAVAFATIAALVVLYGSLAIVAVVGLTRFVLGTSVGAAWLDTLRSLTILAIAVLEIVAVVVGIACWVGIVVWQRSLGARLEERRNGDTASWHWLHGYVLDGLAFLIVALVTAVASGLVVFVGLEVFRATHVFLASGLDGAVVPQVPHGAAILAYIFAAAFAFVLRYFTIEFLGDIVIYLSSYKVSRFYKIRDNIRDCGTNAGQGIYRAVGENGRPLYDRVILVGHSLGSILAYDTLNALLVEDEAGCTPDTSRLRIRRRTSTLVTFGSPLDKTAYLFRAKSAPMDGIRDAIACGTQPLLEEGGYGLEPGEMQWINIRAPADWFSGPLTYYEEPGKAGTHIHDVKDPDAWIPLYAHIQYWRNPTLRSHLYEAIVGDGSNSSCSAWPCQAIPRANT